MTAVIFFIDFLPAEAMLKKEIRGATMPKTRHVFSDRDIAALKRTIIEKFGGNESALARALGILQPSSINQYKNRTTKACTQGTWEKLYPELQNYYDTKSVNIDDKNPEEITQTSSVKDVIDMLDRHAPGRQIITGIINVYGVPVEKVITAIRESNLNEKQRQELREKIFS